MARVLRTDQGTSTATVTAPTRASRHSAARAPLPHQRTSRAGAITADTGRTSSARPNSTPTATRRARPGARAAAGSPSSTSTSATSRNRNSVSVRTMALWKIRLGHSAHTAAATRPTRSPPRRRPSTNTRPMVATDSATLDQIATSKAATCPGSSRTSHITAPSARG